MTNPQLEEPLEHQREEEPHFLADPDVSEAFALMLQEFSQESDRGAVLIAADIVSEHLARIITRLAPKTFHKKQLKNLLSYPGPLATFASRADVAFIAGFIGESAHRSIEVLRKLRNEAAHSQGAFTLANHEDSLFTIGDLGPGAAAGVHQSALEIIFRSIVETLSQRGIELEAQIGSNPFSSPSEIAKHISKHGEAMEAIEGRLPRMRLAFGVWILLGLISHQHKVIIRERRTKGEVSEPART